MIPLYVDGRFGMLHPAAGSHGVLICGTLGDEALNVYRPLVHLAEHFARAGLPTLRLEYYGVGDSGGDDGEPGRFQSWLDGIAAGVRRLRENCGVGPVTLLGVRIGAALAARAACDVDDVAALILLAPVASGRRFVREVALRANAIAEIWQTKAGVEDGGWFEAHGLRVDRATRDALEQLDLAKLPRCPAPLALVLDDTDSPAGRVAVERLGCSGVEVSSETLAGLAEMLRDPYENAVPHAAFERALAWHRQIAQHGAGTAVAAAVGATSVTPIAAFAEAGRRPPTAAATEPWRATAPATVHCRPTAAAAEPAEQAVGAVLRTDAGNETPIRFGIGNALFGILSVPVRPRESAPPVLIANSGANPRSGNSRSAVAIARWLATHGIASLRMDSAGTGDSALATGERGRPYSAQEDRDVIAGIDELTHRFGRPVMVLGMCSGAFHALRAAYEDRRIAGVMLVNLQKLAWQDGESLSVVQRSTFRTTRFYLHHLASGPVWQRLLRGEINISGIGQALVGRAGRRCMALADPALTLLLRRETRVGDIRRKMRGLRQRRIPVLFLFSGNDPGLDEIAEYFGANGRQLRRHPNVMLRTLEGADHTLSMQWARDALLRLIATFLRQRCHLAIDVGDAVAIPPPRTASARRETGFIAPVAIDSPTSAA